jgi:hypothetical protein
MSDQLRFGEYLSPVGLTAMWTKTRSATRHLPVGQAEPELVNHPMHLGGRK